MDLLEPRGTGTAVSNGRLGAMSRTKDKTKKSRDKIRYLRTPRTLARFIYPCMATVINDKQSVLRFMLLDHIGDLEHQLQMGILRRDREDVGGEVVALAEALLQVLKLGEYEQIVRLPVKHESLYLGVPLGTSAVGERPRCRLGEFSC